MEKIVEIFQNIYLQVGSVGVIFLALLTCAFFLLIEISKAIGAAIGRNVAFNADKKHGFFGFFSFKKNKINEHYLFAKYKYLLNARLPQLKIKCPVRKKVFTRLMEIRIKSHQEEMLEFVKSDFNNLDHENFKIELQTFMSGCNISWKKKAAEINFPMIVIQKYEEHTKTMKVFVQEFIDSVCDSTRTYHTNNDKVGIVLDLFSVLEDYMVTVIEQIIDSLNGELSKTEFEGVKCLHCDDCVFPLDDAIKHFNKPVDYVGANAIKILLINKDKKTSRFLKQKIEGFGNIVDVADNNNEVFSKLNERVYDVVLLNKEQFVESNLEYIFNVYKLPCVYCSETVDNDEVYNIKNPLLIMKKIDVVIRDAALRNDLNNIKSKFTHLNHCPVSFGKNIKNVLYVDNNIAYCNDVTKYFENIGINVFAVHSVSEAIILLDTTKTDVCVLEYGLTSLSGDNLIPVLTKLNIPYFFFTDNSNIGFIKDLSVDILLKTRDFESLKDKILTIIGGN